MTRAELLDLLSKPAYREGGDVHVTYQRDDGKGGVLLLGQGVLLPLDVQRDCGWIVLTGSDAVMWESPVGESQIIPSVFNSLYIGVFDGERDCPDCTFDDAGVIRCTHMCDWGDMAEFPLDLLILPKGHPDLIGLRIAGQ